MIRVADDGIGGVQEANGSGLHGLADRVRAHRGTLTIDSDPVRGTILVAELPCAS